MFEVLMELNRFILIIIRKTARIMNILSSLVNNSKFLCQVEGNLEKEHLEWIALVVEKLEGKIKSHKEEEAKIFKMKLKKNIKISFACLEAMKINIINDIIKIIKNFMLKIVLHKLLKYWINHWNHLYHQGK